MSVEVVTLGPNSAMLSLNNILTTDDLDEAVGEVINFLTSHGWEIHDQCTAKSNIVPETGNHKGIILRSPMADAPEVYKYIGIWEKRETSSNSNPYSYLYFTSYENWNNETHVGVNQAPARDTNNRSQSYMAVELVSDYTIYMFASSRYIAYSTVSSTNNITSNAPCLLEISKDNNAEVTGEYPRFVIFSLRYFYQNTMKSEYTTETTGAQSYYPVLTRGLRNISSKLLNTSNGSNLLGSTYPNTMPPAPNPFEPDKIPVYNVYFCDPDILCPHTRGRGYGIKLLQNKIGKLLDIIEIPCDEEGFFDKDGELVEHYIVPVYADGNFYGRVAFPK